MRLHTFGCSFTKYSWSTWADILGKEFEIYTNYGRTGAGNTYIFNHVMQAVAEEKMSSADTVIIMWSTIPREDRYIKNSWNTPGNIYNQEFYEEGFMKYVDPEHFLIRDLAHIAAVYHVLENVKCKFIFLSMMPVSHIKEYLNQNFLDKFFKKHLTDTFINKYKKYINFIRPSMFEVVYYNNWYSRSNELHKEPRWYDFVKGADWPTPEQWESRDFKLSTEIEEEICRFLQANHINEILKFKMWQKIDHHPTPKLHLEYIDSVLPEFKISETTRRLVNEEQTRILVHGAVDTHLSKSTNRA